MTEVYIKGRTEPIKVQESISTIYDRMLGIIEKQVEEFMLDFMPLCGINGDIVGVNINKLDYMIEKSED